MYLWYGENQTAVVDLDSSYFLQSWKYFVEHSILLSHVKLREESEARKGGGRENERDRMKK